MIYVNQDKECGSGRFTDALFLSIRDVLYKKFSKEQMDDFDNSLAFQKAIWLDELSQKDFKIFFDIVNKIKLDEKFSSEMDFLLDSMKSDPRFNE